MKSIGKKWVLTMVLITVGVFSLFAQTEIRSYYVSANGSDETNNGRSEETPFKTLTHAAEMANKGAVKVITVLGSLGPAYFEINNTGTAEIIIRGKSDSEKAYLLGDGKNRVVRISGKGAVRLENVEISGGNGGLYTVTSTVTLGKGVEIKNNRAVDGGGVAIGGGTLTILDGCIISGNTASGNTSIGYMDNGNGGGVFVSSGCTLIMSGGIISGNSASCGGGVGLGYARSTFKMTGGTITYNTSSGGSGDRGEGGGGGVDVRGGTFTMSGGTISKNTSGNGGGVYVERSGGGMYGEENAGTFIMSGGEINSNTAKKGGGGVYIWENTFTLSSGTISGNTAKISGGGVYGNIIMSAGKISDNTAETGAGGGIYGKCEIKNGSITNNTAKNNGGGIRIYSSASSISSGEISGNKAEYGGGVYAGENLTISGGKITGNYAEFVGGGLYVENGKTLTQGKVLISGNTAGDGEGEDVFRQQ